MKKRIKEIKLRKWMARARRGVRRGGAGQKRGGGGGGGEKRGDKGEK